jgi:hypothetical protein
LKAFRTFLRKETVYSSSAAAHNNLAMMWIPIWFDSHAIIQAMAIIGINPEYSLFLPPPVSVKSVFTFENKAIAI